MGAKSTGRVTAYTVAKESGVSQATVSYILNNSTTQTVSAETRKRVLDAAKALNYRPHAAARTLSMGHSEVIVFLMPDFPLGHVMSNLLDVLSAALFAHHRRLVMYRRIVGVPIDDIIATVSPLAVISLGPLQAEEVRLLTERGIRMQIINTGDPTSTKSALAQPQATLGRNQADFLIGRGHRTLGFAMPDDSRLNMLAYDRLKGVQEACAAASLAEPAVRIFSDGLADATEQVAVWRAHDITGICAYNDDIAVAVLAGARENNLSVPEQLAVIGVDDIPMAALVVPALTTMRLRVDDIALSLVEDLMGIPLNERTATNTAPELVVRASA